jgi:MoxR-like ATPase
MAKSKNTPKAQSVQNVREIHTGLINKGEVFRMLALAESVKLPLLLIGDPGVAKTKAVLDFSKAWLLKDVDKNNPNALTEANAKFMNSVYILETDEGTKSSEVKGMPDLETLFVENKYQLSTPIADCEVVVVNEIDKASSNIRNSLLGVMNEKFLFNGKEKIPCNWKLFIGTCNSIPKEEANSPFWDRFMLKMTVSRVLSGELAEYFKQGDRAYHEIVPVNMPTDQELAEVIVTPAKMEKFLSVAYQFCSDRTLTFVPTLVRAVARIWELSVDNALIKVAEIMIGSSASAQLQALLITSEQKTLISKIDMLKSLKTPASVNSGIEEIEKYLNTYVADGKLDNDQIAEISQALEKALADHPIAKDLAATPDMIDVVI